MAGQSRAAVERTTPRRRRQVKRIVGAGAPVRVVTPEPPPVSRRATFDIAVPRVSLKSLPVQSSWRASQPKIAAAVLMLVLCAALYQMFNHDIFFVGDVAVIGNKLVPRDEVQTVSGIRGWNIFFLEPNRVAAAVKTLPEFKTVEVFIGLPNTAEIYVTEREPRFVWEVGGKNYWVDAEGVAMRPRGKLPNGWHVRDADGKAVKYGERVNADAFNAAASLINAWKAAPRFFEWTRAHGLTARDPQGRLVYFGSANQMADKVTALEIVTLQLERDKRKVNFIDLGSGLPYYQEQAAVPTSQ